MRTKAAVLSAGMALSLSAGAALARTVNLSQRSSGRTLTVRIGDVVRVTLGGASASTGYSWRQPKRPAVRVLRFTGASVRQVNCPPHTVGCAETTTFTYKAKGAGRTAIDLVLMPPTGSRAARRFTETVIVR